MKIALYIEDGIEQLVLTPESEHERKMLSLLHDQSRTVSILRGAFYECRGGWVRQGDLAVSSHYDGYGRNPRKDDESTMLVLRRPPAKEPDSEAETLAYQLSVINDEIESWLKEDQRPDYVQVMSKPRRMFEEWSKAFKAAGAALRRQAA